ncbi:(2Fe-2S)-binding protein [Paenibacillus tianjinensis]|uniref:(2Fe-2S)-binding protein n=1 Tax=Paenibacillus tianjinensis TaxID=2810347 RepID=A0ABX7L411_9BACL|nr:(2Fe-2S)-binding protein [Paenibacillus tianjinensis]QSF42540.1 (2Fe-2S)-binding protein [Paenibacillus tianjinensis]
MDEAQTSELIKDFGSKFDLHPEVPEGARYSFIVKELIREDGMRAFIECYRPIIKGLDDKVAASYFAGSFGNVALAMQYAISVYSVMPEVSLSSLSVHLIPAEGYWRVAFSLDTWTFSPAPADAEQRICWRNGRLTQFYQETAAPLLSVLSKVSGLGPSEIWGQLPTKFNYYIEMLAAGRHSGLIQTIQADYRYLTDEMPAAVFKLARNPFHVKVRKVEALADPASKVQVRNRCCLYYRTKGGSYCYTCPRLTEEERAKRRAEYRNNTASAQA